MPRYMYLHMHLPLQLQLQLKEGFGQSFVLFCPQLPLCFLLM